MSIRGSIALMTAPRYAVRDRYVGGMLRLALLIAAVVCLLIFTLLSLGTFVGNRPFAWLGAGLTLFAASFI